MDAGKIAAFADQLFYAERNRRAVPPLSEQDGSINIDDAYHIQLANVERALKMGYRISGKKIGLTSPGIQKQFGVNEPDYGHLFAAMDCPDGKVKTGGLLRPKIEGELAFVLKADLSGGKVRREDVLNATDHVAAAFEIVDSRVADWRIKLVDTVADNASSGRYILGRGHLEIGAVDLPSVTMKLYKNGEPAGEGAGSAVLGDPCAAVAWLANRLWDYGVTLKAGEIILSGAFSAAPAAAKGDVFRAEFSSFGTVDAEFI
ncbi:MAG: fumarylacetoacetate hydrolase family protein [Spirochaetaceae bacterium]|jgi:2-keto-4-pentenoate hydratase|nr:fumarylacetoacetate hydrolase family protein [Spirochaetaceae bacterium]